MIFLIRIPRATTALQLVMIQFQCGEDDYYDTPEPKKDPSNEQESSRSHSNPFLPSTTFRQEYQILF